MSKQEQKEDGVFLRVLEVAGRLPGQWEGTSSHAVLGKGGVGGLEIG